MKTLKCKPTLEVLEDRLVPATLGEVLVAVSSGRDRPMESMSINFRAPAEAALLRVDTSSMADAQAALDSKDGLILSDCWFRSVKAETRIAQVTNGSGNTIRDGQRPASFGVWLTVGILKQPGQGLLVGNEFGDVLTGHVLPEEHDHIIPRPMSQDGFQNFLEGDPDQPLARF